MKRFSIWNTCIRLSLIIATLSFLPACFIVVDEHDDYYRRRWQLEIIVYGSVSYQPPEAEMYTLSFQEKDVVSGQASCAEFEGHYEVGRAASSLSVNEVAVDDSGCGDSSLSTLYLQGIRDARSMEGSADELVIRFEGADHMMRFKPY